MARTAWALVVVLFCIGCSSGRFDAVCEHLSRGTSRADVESRMAAVGAQHNFINESDFWQYEMLSGTSACEVEFDQQDRVRRTSLQYWSR